jgi:hypothetical protein
MPVTFIANREVRLVPRGWEHPRDAGGRHRPLLPRDSEWRTEAGRRDLRQSGLPLPGDDAFMPDPGADAAIAAHETTTEGTPISPAFANTPQGKLALCNWCAENAFTFGSHKADAEAWAAVLFGESVAAADATGRLTFA